MNKKVVVTGIGVVSPFGNGLQVLWNNIIQKNHAIKQWADLESEDFRCHHACRAPHIEDNSITRGKTFAQEATKQALELYQITPNADTGIFIGSTMGESKAFEDAATDKTIPYLDYTASSFAESIKRKYRITGPTRIYSTACAAGNYALGCAAQSIRSGRISSALAGGIEPFSRIAMAGFSRSRAMALKGLCKPFDKNRSGMCLGEGAAMFFIETEEQALKHDRKPLAQIEYLGLSCDAYHLTRPDPSGKGIIEAFKECLRLSQLKPQNIDLICAHGTGTIHSDKSEAKAIASVFGERTPVSGIKGAIGHSLGAATAISAAICIQAIQHQIIPPTVNHDQVDPEFRINIVNEKINTTIKQVINSGYGFGGINSTLLISKWIN